MSNSVDIERLLNDYTENISRQAEFIRMGDARSGNRCAKKYTTAGKHLINLGSEGYEALIALLQHANVDVRVLTACLLLNSATPECLAVLRKEATGDSLAAYGARQTLHRWECGEHSLEID